MTLPLAGCRVALLRVGDTGQRLAESLRGAGAAVSTVLVGDVVDRDDAALRREVGSIERYAWVAVTSANAARRLGLWAARWPASTRIGAVGPSTAAAVAAAGLRCHAVAEDGTARSLADRIDAGPVLFLAAASARDDLAVALGSRGIEVVAVVSYDVAARAIRGDAGIGELDVLVAMSPTAIDALVDADDEVRASIPRTVAIGPTTAAHAAARGWPVAAVARRRDADAVRDAVRSALER